MSILEKERIEDFFNKAKLVIAAVGLLAIGGLITTSCGANELEDAEIKVILKRGSPVQIIAGQGSSISLQALGDGETTITIGEGDSLQIKGFAEIGGDSSTIKVEDENQVCLLNVSEKDGKSETPIKIGISCESKTKNPNKAQDEKFFPDTQNSNPTPNQQPNPTPTNTPTQNEQPKQNSNKSPKRCVSIGDAGVPNAFRGWIRLGKPYEIIYIKKGADPTIIKDTDGDGAPNLPKGVKRGDQFCIP